VAGRERDGAGGTNEASDDEATEADREGGQADVEGALVGGRCVWGASTASDAARAMARGRGGGNRRMAAMCSAPAMF